MFPVTIFSDLRQICFQIGPCPFPDFSGVISEENGLIVQDTGVCSANSEGDFGWMRKLSIKKAAENDDFFRNWKPKIAKPGRFMHAYGYAT